MTLLRVETLAVELLRDGARYPLVKDASLEVAPGETLAVVGESGSGKSLTALAVMGLLAPELSIARGRVIFDGQDLGRLSPEQLREIRGRDMAMVFQEPMTSLNPVLSIGRQLTEGMRLKLGLSRREARELAASLLAEVGIADPERRLSQFPHQFSGGMRQRVMIAMALACQPKLILADEPTTALDVTIQAQILALTARLCREHGVGLVLITHNLGIVARYADRVSVMYAGHVVEEASAADLYARPAHPYTRGLLDSVPRLDTERRTALKPIPGAPPDPMRPVTGCPFHPRCAHAGEICRTTMPPPVRAESRIVACHAPLEAVSKTMAVAS
ncbi:MAG: ABC transporter ATP-binding protein [Pseudomonadota bacterium]